MHPLRFPNSGIKAKVFVRKISFKLRVMRLNRVELFYALVAAIGNKSRRCLRGRGGHLHVVCMQRWLVMARPLAGAVGHGLATCKGRPVVAKAPFKGAIGYGQTAGTVARGWSVTAWHPQGAADCGFGARRKVACKGGRQQGRRPWRCRPQGWPPLGRAVAGGQG
ncbi:hypothetical protein BHM03_00035797 [Ensete ventricosum]|nr:hypothetical protein BHM03_00035797 [Ensete ventricosum]